MKKKFILTIGSQDKDHFEGAVEQMKAFFTGMCREYNNTAPKGSKMSFKVVD